MFNEQQKAYIQKISGKTYDFNNLSDDEWVEIEDVVADKLACCGFSEGYEPTEDGIMCESILDALNE